jgi:hypothetical protein
MLVACSNHAPSSAESVEQLPPSGTASAKTDAWVGRWSGPEGTYLRIAGDHGAYEITVANLDGPQTYAGSSSGDGIEFERNGRNESIDATDGIGTGMKWLTDKHDCLVIRQGEGFCRD